MNAGAWRLTLAAAALMALVTGARSAFGLFVSPLNGFSGIGLARLSLAIAVGQLAIGFAQPAIGAMADRHGARRVIIVGAVLLCATTALPALWSMPGLLAVAVVASAVAGSAVGSNGLLLGEVNRAVPAARAGLAVGVVGVGASVGQLLLGPATQWAIDHRGWPWALVATALLSLLALPLAAPFRRTAGVTSPRPAQPVADVLREWRFWRVALSFGVCGFHIAFLAVHMPGVIERCGLGVELAGRWIAVSGAANIAGSLLIGLAMKRHDAARLLSGLYLVRAGGIVALLLLPPKPWVLLAFAAWMGASYMATLPPTSQLIARQHGLPRLGTLFGVVMLVHQLGSCAGIGIGGWTAEHSGGDRVFWCVDVALALLAAVLVWPRRPGAGTLSAAAGSAAA